MASRYVTEDPGSARTDTGKQSLKSTPIALEWEEEDGRNDPAQRFALYRLCDCYECDGKGRVQFTPIGVPQRCPECRGEGRMKELVATCGTPEAVGVALVTLAREGEFSECPLGLLDRMGEKGHKWLISPWLASPRNVTDAARTLAKSKKRAHTD